MNEHLLLKYSIAKICFLGVCAVMMLLCTAVGKIAFPALGLTALMLFFGNDEDSLILLVFLMPFASIFKSGPGATSFYTYLMLLYCAKKLCYLQQIPTSILLFGLYIIITEFIGNNIDILNTIKIVSNLLLVSYALESRQNCRKNYIYTAYIVGVILSSAFALLDSSMFRISLYTGGNQSEGGDYSRFVGLNTDPNYYVVNVIVALCLLCVLFKNYHGNLLFIGICAAALFYFAVITYSKSAMLMLGLPFLLFYRISRKEQHDWLTIFFALFCAVGIVLILTGKIRIFDTVLKRFSIGSGGKDVGISNITSGRTDLWLEYLEYYFRHPVQTIFGRGIGAPLIVRGSHNIYVEIPNYFGLVGMGMLMVILNEYAAIVRKVKESRGLVQYSVLLCVAVMYFFLSGVFDYQIPILLMLGYCVLEEA